MSVADSQRSSAASCFELKADSFTLPVIRLLGTDLGGLAEELLVKVNQAPEFFQNTPVIIDLQSVRQTEAGVDFALLLGLLQVTGTVSPYVQGEVFYGFGSASTQPNLPDSLLDPVKDLLSPYGFTAAFGAEYFASDNFGIGGEVGIRYAVTKASSNDPVVDVSGFLPKTASSGPLDTKFTSMTIYSGLSINFKF